MRAELDGDFHNTGPNPYNSIVKEQIPHKILEYLKEASGTTDDNGEEIDQIQ